MTIIQSSCPLKTALFPGQKLGLEAEGSLGWGETDIAASWALTTPRPRQEATGRY